MHVALLANTKAGGGRAGAEEVAERLRTACTEVEVHDLQELAPAGDGRVALDTAADRLVVAGGDGSLGPAAALAQRLGVPLAVVPTGTANDFARALGLPRGLDEAVALAADPGASVREIEVGSAGGRPFLNAASSGLSVLAARHAAPLKPRLGPFAYPLGALRAGVTGAPLVVRVRVDGEERFAGEAWQVVVACTGHFGGGSSIGGTDVEDGQVDVAVVPGGSRLALARRAVGMLRGGLGAQGPVADLRGRSVEVDGVAEFNVDGEACAVEPPRFSVAGRVEVVVP